MSNNCFEKPIFRQSSHRLLMTLKTRGPRTAAELGGELGITKEAARQHMMKLAAEGLATASMESSGGVGRPAQFWSLTSEGNARFPDAHAQLTVQLIGLIRTHLVEAPLEHLLDA